MKLSKPAMMSAFLCPGLGQWAAGKRVLGALIISVTVVIVLSPFVRFFIAIVRPAPCDPFSRGVWGCTMDAMAGGWHVTWPLLLAAAPLFAIVYVGAVLHANRLTIP